MRGRGLVRMWLEGRRVKIGWKPDSLVRGAYWVESNEENFTVHGVVPDGQGGFEHVTGTATQSATPQQALP